MVDRVFAVAQDGVAAGMAGRDGAVLGGAVEGVAMAGDGAGPIGDGAHGPIITQAPMAATLLPNALRAAADSRRPRLNTVL
jgi:hypothetical protein